MANIVQDEFDEYLRAVYADPIPMPSDQHTQLRDAFFGGALIANRRLPSEKHLIAQELADYLVAFKIRHNIPEKAS